MDTTATNGQNPEDERLIDVRNVTKHFPVRSGLLQRVSGYVQAVDDVSFFVRKGETLGLVGETGCGKTTLGRAVLRLIEPDEGSILFEGEDITHLPVREMKSYRRNMQIIFQDPFSALDPRMQIGDIIAEGLQVHGIGDRDAQREMVRDVLERVGMYPEHARRYPHEFSGGQRQRIGIARVLVLQPKFVVCDEPVSALDVSIQSQVLNLLRYLQKDFGLTYLFVAHNLSVVEHISDRVAVMYLGKIVEMTTREELYAGPLHPYTLALLSAIPMPDPGLDRERIILTGDVPSPINPPRGCRFHPRCPVAIGLCSELEPELREVAKDHWVACHRVS